MYLVLGDWSNDGHGKYEKILLGVNVPVDVVQQAYKDSCKLTGVSFNDGEEYTGKNQTYKEVNDYTIAHNYEEPTIPIKAFNKLQKFGLTEKMLADWDTDDLIENEDNRPIRICTEVFVMLWIWFVRLSNPKIELEGVENDIPYINGFWDKKLNVTFGYGLYD
jgi:hypothetical protein